MTNMEITFVGSPPAFARLTHGLRSEDGVTIRFDSPIERRGAGAPVAVTVVVSIFSNMTYDALKVVVHHIWSGIESRHPESVIHLPAPDQQTWGSE